MGLQVHKGKTQPRSNEGRKRLSEPVPHALHPSDVCAGIGQPPSF